MAQFSLRSMMREIALLAVVIGCFPLIDHSPIPFLPFAAAVIAAGAAIGAVFGRLRSGSVVGMVSSPAAWMIWYGISNRGGC